MVRTLAEPNLTAISGEVRDLHRRRRISDSDRLTCEPTTTARLPARPDRSFKKFGISPQLHAGGAAEGRISLQVMTEVSEALDRKRR